jgi:hypothetical protein
MRKIACGVAAILLLVGGQASAGSWRIVKDRWSEADEKGFGQFVQAIGETNCSSSESCLRNAANPYRNTDQHFLDIDVDCAKLPYLLRAYYAWKNGLPFSFVDGVSGEGGDLRYTHTANRATSRHDIVDDGGGIDAPNTVRDVVDTVFSGTYRTDAGEKRGVLSDFYSPALQPGSIRAGTIVYDVNGHVGIVYKAASRTGGRSGWWAPIATMPGISWVAIWPSPRMTRSPTTRSRSTPATVPIRAAIPRRRASSTTVSISASMNLSASRSPAARWTTTPSTSSRPPCRPYATI